MKSKHTPLRRCIGCNQSKPKPLLIRIVKKSSSSGSSLFVDDYNKIQSRGTYICKSAECLNKARKSHRLEKKLTCKIPEEFYKILESKINSDEQ